MSKELFDACEKGDLEKGRRLLKNNGANIDAKDDNGLTPLHYACWSDGASSRGHKSIVSVLIENGAGVNTSDNYGWTPLHRASYKGNEGVVVLLLQKGANIHAQNTYGRTALHLASQNGHEGVVELLLFETNDANPNVTDNKGKTALQVAQEVNEQDCVDIIQSFLGDRKEAFISRRSHEEHECVAPAYISTDGEEEEILDWRSVVVDECVAPAYISTDGEEEEILDWCQTSMMRECASSKLGSEEQTLGSIARDGGPRGVVGGRLMQGEEFQEYCERNGMCRICGQIRVKKKKTGVFGRTLTDIEIEVDSSQNIIVYKGYHISPQCYSLAQAKAELGEDIDTVPKRSKRNRKKQYSHGHVRKELTQSDRAWRDQQRAEPLRESEPSFGVSSTEVLDADCKPAAVDELTQNSGGSSSQEQGASIGSWNEPRAESPIARTPFAHQISSSSNDPAPRHHSAGHIKSSSSGDVATLAAGSRRPFSNSDPTPKTLRGGSASTGDVYNQSNNETRRSSNDSAYNRSPNNFAHNPLPTIPSEGPNETPEETAIRKLEEEAGRLQIYDFMVQLGCHRAKPDVLQRGFQLMREVVWRVHQAEPDKRYVFPNDNWCKTIKSAMSEHEEDEGVLVEGATTITFICSVSAKYKADLIRNHNSKEIVAAMETHPSAEESCCIALECLTRKDSINVHWREEHAATAFEGIKCVLSDPSRSGTSYAILALHNLTCQENFRPAFVLDHIRCIFEENGVMNTFSAVMQDESVSEGVFQAALSLLRLHFTNESISESLTAPSSEALLQGLLGAMYSFTSASFHEEICGFLSLVQIPAVIPGSDQISWKQTLSDSICDSMRSRHATDESVQLAGLSALCNIFGDGSRDDYVADIEQIIDVVISAMNNFDSAELQAKGCLALACICADVDWYKDAVVRKGGISAVSHAFQTHVLRISTDATPAEDVKVAASAALGSLALSSAAALEMRQSNLLEDFQAVVKRDGLSPGNPCVRTCLINLISVAQGESGYNGDSEYIFLTEMVTELLLESAAEDDVQTLLTALNALSSMSPSALDIVLSAEGGNGTRRIVGLLEEYPDNGGIQEAGCAMLANIYYHVPFEGELKQSTYRSIGSQSVQVTTHSEREITALTSALNTHKVNARVVKNACEALCNFVCGVNVVAADPDDVQLPVEVAALFSGIPKEADNAMAIHEENPDTMKSILRLLLVSVRLLEDDEMQRCSSNLIARIFETLIRFPHDQEIHLCACKIIGKFVSLENESIDASAANAEGLRALLLSLHMDDESVVSCAVGIISSLLQRVFSLSNDIVEMDEYFSCLVGCIHRFPGSVNVQAEVCSILTSLATLTDPFVKTIIANNNGVMGVLTAMRSHREQAYVLEHGSRALGAIAEGIPDDILLSTREAVCDQLLQAIHRCSNMEGVCGATLVALCEFCKRDGEYFEYQIVDANAVPSIVKVMLQFITSEDIQEGGCKLLWLLASKNDENKCVLGTSGAIFALVSAMLAHVGSTAIQKEALTAMKHVARVSANKEALERNETTDVVRLALYANLEEPQVVSAALSALNDIAVDTSTRQVKAVTDDTMNSVLRAMQMHPAELEVQKIACWLLRSYSFNPRNLMLMRSSRQELLGLLIAASSSFPEDCGERAQSILEKL